jgi:type IV secretion system protein VirD4
MVENSLHGTSQWAERPDLQTHKYLEGEGAVFGCFVDKKKNFYALTYGGDSHMLTVAPTRSGKGTTQIIPSLMDHEGAVLCIDPKGENAIITAQARENLHGQKTYVVDPWGIATGVLEREPAQFNPLDMLDPESDNLADDAMMIADALIMPENGDSHWSNEARAMIMGFIIHLVTSPTEEGARHLGRLREILSLPPSGFKAVEDEMAKNGVELAKSAAFRMQQKSERELSSVISTAQQNTHFLEGPKVKKSLEKSSFDFADLKNDDNPISIYLVLPADRLNTHGRWLRLIVSMAITAMVRGGNKPKKSALFLLDEFAALGKLAVVEQAFGLMAGFGMQIHAIIQDLSQLQDLYDRRWQTFLGNAGVLQVFGTRDVMTAEYVSKLAGNRTIEKISKATGDIRKGGMFSAPNPDYASMSDQSFGRLLIMPEEIMRLPSHNQLVFMPQCPPIYCGKIEYYRNARFFDDDGNPLFRVHPNNPQTTEFQAFDQKTIKRMQDAKNRKEELTKKSGGFFGFGSS